MDCIVCLQPGGLKFCMCSYVHLDCLRKTIDTVPSHAEKCPICHTPYKMKITYACGICKKVKSCLVLCGFETLLYIYIATTEYEPMHSFHICFIVFSLMLAFLLSYQNKVKTGFYCIRSKQLVEILPYCE